MIRYFHGGIPGLKDGDRILPPSITGMPTTADYPGAPVFGGDRIYATIELRVARVYAALAPFGGRGSVYEVKLDDPIELDGFADCAIGDSVCAPSAGVIQVLERQVCLSVARVEIAAQIAELESSSLAASRQSSRSALTQRCFR